MLYIGPTYGRGPFRPESQEFTSPVLEGVGLLFYDVGLLAHGTGKETRRFEQRGVDSLVAEAVAYVGGMALDVAPVFLFLGKDVLDAARCLKQGYAPKDFAQNTRRL